MHVGTYITLCTVRLRCSDGRGNMSTGTGFFYSYDVPGTQDTTYPVVVTNKHVIDGASVIEFDVQVVQTGVDVARDGTANNEIRFPCKITNLSDSVVQHPDPDVDLCVIPIAGLLQHLQERQLALKQSFVDRKMRYLPGEPGSINAIEPIVMVGYPNGLWDEHNNRPIARRGQTASHPRLNWNGRRQFMIDAACFGGSSGSPVFLYEDGLIRTEDNDSVTPGTRAVLLGILWGGPVLNAQGRLEAREVPTGLQQVPVTPHMLNLGFVVQASALDDIFPILH